MIITRQSEFTQNVTLIRVAAEWTSMLSWQEGSVGGFRCICFISDSLPESRKMPSVESPPFVYNACLKIDSTTGTLNPIHNVENENTRERR